MILKGGPWYVVLQNTGNGENVGLGKNIIKKVLKLSRQNNVRQETARDRMWMSFSD